MAVIFLFIDILIAFLITIFIGFFLGLILLGAMCIYKIIKGLVCS